MAHRSINRNIYEARMAPVMGDAEAYFTMLYNSPFKTHRRKALRISEQAKAVSKMAEVVKAASDPTEE